MPTPIKTVADFYIIPPGLGYYNPPARFVADTVIAGTATGLIRVVGYEAGVGYLAGLTSVSFTGAILSPSVQVPTDVNAAATSAVFINAFADGSAGFVWSQSGTLPPSAATDQNVYGRTPTTSVTLGSTTSFAVAASTANEIVDDSIVLSDGRFATLVNRFDTGSLRLTFQNANGTGQSFIDLTTPQLGLDYELVQMANGGFQITGRSTSNIYVREISSIGVVGSWLNANSTLVTPLKTFEAVATGQSGFNDGSLQLYEENTSATTWSLSVQWVAAGPANGGSRLIASGTQGSAATSHNGSIARLLDGRFIVTWDDAGVIYGRLLNSSNFDPDGLAFVVSNSPGGTTAQDADVTALADGRFAVAWEESGVSGGLPYTTLKMSIFDPRTTGVTLTAVAAGSSFVGSDFADTMSGGVGNDTFIGGAGVDILNGAGGIDTVDYSSAATTVVLHLDTAIQYGQYASGAGGAIETDTLSGFENATGGSAGDYIYGNAVANVLTGNGGNDVIQAGDGNDTIDAGDGPDWVDASYGDDTVIGGLGADTVYGGAGIDTIQGGDDADQLYGGPGADSIDGGNGNDVLFVDSADTFVNGGAGIDYIIWQDTAVAANLDLAAVSADFFYGFTGNDVVSVGAVKIRPEMYGGGGNDTLSAPASVGSILLGQDGNDRLISGTGIDHFVGGPGSDTFAFAPNGGTDYVYSYERGPDRIDMTALAGAGIHSLANLSVNTAYGGSGWYGYGYGTGTVWVQTGSQGSLTAPEFVFA